MFLFATVTKMSERLYLCELYRRKIFHIEICLYEKLFVWVDLIQIHSKLERILFYILKSVFKYAYSLVNTKERTYTKCYKYGHVCVFIAFYRENLDFRYASTIPFEFSSMHLRIEYLIKFILFINQG